MIKVVVRESQKQKSQETRTIFLALKQNLKLCLTLLRNVRKKRQKTKLTFELGATGASGE
jgi:adenine-specific DNA methylase